MTEDEYWNQEDPINWIGDPCDDWFFGKNDMIKFAKGYANHQTASLREEIENTRRVYEYDRDEHRKVEKDRHALREEVERLKKENTDLKGTLGKTVSNFEEFTDFDRDEISKLEEDKETLSDLLHEAQIQLEYHQHRFPLGSTPNVLSRIKAITKQQ